MRCKVKIVESNWQYDDMFKTNGWTPVSSVEEADLIQFTGGADVTPALYGEPNTQSWNEVTRDLKEICIFREALVLEKPMAGICRGGQFLNVMGGGKMIQDVSGHANGRQHSAYDRVFNRALMVTSTHHQMMVPGRGGIVLMYASIVGDEDTEAVYYPHINSLCFQPHPEFDTATRDCTDLYFSYLDKLLEGSM